LGPKRPFQANRDVLLDWSGGPNGGTAYGPWTGKTGTAYPGLNSIKGQTHFGWARVKTSSIFPYSVYLTGYAYETIADKPITAGRTKGPEDIVEEPDAVLGVPTPKPATLGLLAIGSPGLSIWRREESVGAAR
jgi:hypothetical protein